MKSAGFKYSIALVFFIVGNVILIGQNKESTDKNRTNGEPYFSADLYYVSNAVFMGRRDSIADPYLYPLLTYHYKSGFYAQGALSYLAKSDSNRIDLFLVSAGFDFTAKKLFGDISFTKYFFSDDSYNVISEITADVTAKLKYDFDILNISFGTSTFFNNNSSTDLIMSSELSYDFVTKDNKFQISPLVGFYLGSQNFYEAYFTNKRLGNGRGFGNNSGETTTAISVQEDKKFSLLAIEFSLPIWYSNKSLTLLFLPTYVVPQNASTFIVDGVAAEEDLEETFYWLAGLSYRF